MKTISYDLVGQKFNKLTVINRVSDYVYPDGKRMIDRWECLCECGKKCIVYGKNLRLNKTKSCGCIKKDVAKERIVDYTGHQFGSLTVIRQIEKPEKYKNKGTYWLCRCTCGNEVIKIAADIKRENGKTCGKCPVNKYDMSGEIGVGYTSNNKIFYFDKEDFDLIKGFTWCQNSDGYIVAWNIKDKRFIYMHRLITGASQNYVVDHIFHKKNDNRKEFLRVCKHQENIMNSQIQINNTSGCTGVKWNSQINKWTASIMIDRKGIYLGSFKLFEDAVKARIEAENKYFKEYARKEKMKGRTKMKQTNVMLLQDFYKISHQKNMYPPNTTKLYATWTPRSNKYFPESKFIAWFGIQGFIKKFLIEYFNTYFFERDLDEIIIEYREYITKTFDQDVLIGHIVDLHNLGYLPIEISSLPEGMKVPYHIPCAVIQNTHPKFAWIVNFLETLFSCNLWITSTTATTAYLARMINEQFLNETSDNESLWKNSGVGDFSFRGMSGLDSAITSGAAFLTSFIKTSTVPAIKYLCDYYHADLDKEKVGEWSASVEHSCTALNYAIDNNEEDFFIKMITEFYPKQPFSFVADTYNYWNFFDIIEKYKEEIKQHHGCIRIRPDSGVPEKIICGDPDAKDERQRKGSLRLLWEIMGGTINNKGYKVLHPSIGLVYGDSITLDLHKKIGTKMKEMGFAIENVIFGYGSYSFQYRTRDTQGWAYKVTYAEVDDKSIQVFKNPITSDGFKKSQKGMCYVVAGADGITYQDGYTSSSLPSTGNLLETVFRDGKMVREYSLREIRQRLHDGNF